MAHNTIRLLIPFESLVGAISGLSLEDKVMLSQLLEDLIAQGLAQEEIWEQDPTVQADIQEARTAYQAGDYLSIDEYVAQRDTKA